MMHLCSPIFSHLLKLPIKLLIKPRITPLIKQPKLSPLLYLLLSLAFIQSTPVWAKNTTSLPTCVYIASYEPTYPWQNGIIQGLTPTLRDTCHLQTFFMDSKHITDPKTLQKIGLKAKHFIETHPADILLFSDDNAIKYVLKPYFQNTPTPKVFCGANDSIAHYHFKPNQPITGMIEKTGYTNLKNTLEEILHKKAKGAFLGNKGTTEQRHMKTISSRPDLNITIFKANNFKQWLKNLHTIQQDDNFDYIILANTSSLSDFDPKLAQKALNLSQNQLYVSYLNFMMPYADIGIIKSSEEQGNWMGLSAQAILAGTPANEIPIVPNRYFKYWYNANHTKKLNAYHLSKNFIPVKGTL